MSLLINTTPSERGLLVTVEGGATENLTFEGGASFRGKMPMRVYRRFTLRKGVRYAICARVRSTGVPEKDHFQFIGFIFIHTVFCNSRNHSA